ncbi:MAG: hypothetical protein DMG29_14775 [Acidobacteria bacterium]|nr:MAG: hypothetical protein DMG29_14775 [Acidobacteriota bacterium]
MRLKVKKQILIWLALAALLAVCPVFGAVQDEYILRCSPTAISGVLSRHGMTLVRSASEYSVYLVRSPAGAPPAQYLSEVSADLAVAAVEPNLDLVISETPPGLQLNQSTASILDALANPTVIPFFRTMVLSGYVNQPAAALIRVANTQRFFATGAGIVAVIDTGVDPNHTALTGSLVPGYDFTRDLPGIPSEFADLSQSTASILDQSTASILDQRIIVALNQSTASILDQSTASILDTTQVPQAFGHGTMVAGIIHLVAPTAQIMPLKAFKVDGTSNLFDIMRAIYFAVDHGAKVINMSFSMVNSSPELTRAINYAAGHGLICVSSAGNTGKETLVFPAGYRNVMGVASTNNLDVRSTFSNFGHSLIFTTAPGEGIITTYPGKHYAAGWGTSFSTPFVAGTAALLVQTQLAITPGQAFKVLAHAKPLTSDLGWGRLDVYLALWEQVDVHPLGAPLP